MARKNEIYTFQGTGLNDDEKKWGKKRFKDYQKFYRIENLSDLVLLEELVIRESQQESFKKQLELPAKSDTVKENGLIPYKIRSALDKNLEQILILKEKLGLFEDKEQETYSFIQKLKKKHEVYRREHPKEYSFPCPHCSQMIHTKIRINENSHIIMKHPFFEGKFLCNVYLLKLLKENKITKEDISKLIYVPVDYVTWLLKKYNNKI